MEPEDPQENPRKILGVELDYDFAVENFGEDFEADIDLFDENLKVWFRGVELADWNICRLYPTLWVKVENKEPGSTCLESHREQIRSLEVDFDPNSGRPGFEKISLLQGTWWDEGDEILNDCYFAWWTIACTADEIVPEPVPSEVDDIILWKNDE